MEMCVCKFTYSTVNVHAHMSLQRLMLDVLSTNENCQPKSSLSSVRKVIIDADILGQVCCHGAMSELDTIAQLSRQLLIRLFSLREESFWSELQQLLLQWMPYIEVCVLWHTAGLLP